MFTFGRGRSKDKQKVRVKRNKRSGCGQQQQDTRRGSTATLAILDVLCIYSHAICVQRACAGLSPLEALSFLTTLPRDSLCHSLASTACDSDIESCRFHCFSTALLPLNQQHHFAAPFPDQCIRSVFQARHHDRPCLNDLIAPLKLLAPCCSCCASSATPHYGINENARF